jgi:hypothetical protein
MVIRWREVTILEGCTSECARMQRLVRMQPVVRMAGTLFSSELKVNLFTRLFTRLSVPATEPANTMGVRPA